jgi:hypothetical protein
MSVTWNSLSNSPGGYASAMWLMGDGTVLVNLYKTTQLMALHPDPTGSYVDGMWTSVGELLLEKWAFSSAVLIDGRLVTCGGEYSGPGLPQTETNFCEIFDPTTRSSTQFAPPKNWTNIGDGPTALLADGTMMIGNTQGRGYEVGLLDPTTLTWTLGVGNDGSGNEQGYTLMQNGDVLCPGVFDQTSHRYDPGVQAFVPDANMPVMLGAASETGPAIGLMDGRVMCFGASGHTCIYTPGAEGHNGTWVQGPELPRAPNGDQLVAADVSAILEPNGNVFVVVNGPNTATTFAEYDPIANTITLVAGAPDGGGDEYCRTLLLPNGHGLVSTSNGTWYDVGFSAGGDPAWAPTITSFPEAAAVNTTVTLTGTQLCGLSECQGYGDDNQQAEHYPTVRLIDTNGGVTYVRAHHVTTRSIAPGQVASVLVDLPSSLAAGDYTVQAVAMGIPSAGTVFLKVLTKQITAAVVPGTEVLQLFYRGQDNAVWTQWRNPDGSWSNEQGLGGVLT